MPLDGAAPGTLAGVPPVEDGLTGARGPGWGEDAQLAPAPAGRFRPALRAYIPGPGILDESWTIPPIARVD